MSFSQDSPQRYCILNAKRSRGGAIFYPEQIVVVSREQHRSYIYACTIFYIKIIPLKDTKNTSVYFEMALLEIETANILFYHARDYIYS